MTDEATSNPDSDAKQAQLNRLEMARNAPRPPSRVSHKVRTKDGKTKVLKYARRKAILLLCTECLGWEGHSEDCTSTLCPVFPFRGFTLASQHGD